MIGQSPADKLTISVVSHGHGTHLHNLLADLNRVASQSGLRVLVTLNIPEPEPLEINLPNLQLSVIRNTRPRGFGANHNAAFERCATRWFVILNPDLRLPEDPFASLLSNVESTPEIGVAAPRVMNSGGTGEDHVRQNLSPASLWRRYSGGHEVIDVASPARRPDPFYWLAGMFLVFNAAAFRAVGGFDERFFLYCEDYDICARLYAAGYAVQLIPGTRVIHDAQRQSRRSPKHLRWHLASLSKVWCSRSFWRITLGT